MDRWPELERAVTVLELQQQLIESLQEQIATVGMSADEAQRLVDRARRRGVAGTLVVGDTVSGSIERTFSSPMAKRWRR